MANQLFSGFLYTDAGVAIASATINLYDRNTTTPVRATTTTDANGYWAISHATEGRFDVEVVNGSSIRRRKYDTQEQFSAIEVATLRVRNPAFTFDYDIVPAAITADRQLNLPLITATDTLAALALAQTFLTGVKTFNSSILAVRNPADTFSYTIVASAITADRNLTLPLITAADTLAVLGLAQTWTALQSFGTNLGGTLQTAAQPNVTSLGTLTGLTVSGTAAFTASSPFSVANGQTLTFSVTAQTVGAATLTIPNFAGANDTLVFTTLAQTLSSKTFVSPALGTPASGVLTNCTGLPAASVVAGSFGAGAFVISTSLQAATIELGHATDTTLSRVSAGLIAVEGVTVVDVSTAQTLSSKTLTTPTIAATGWTNATHAHDATNTGGTLAGAVSGITRAGGNTTEATTTSTTRVSLLTTTVSIAGTVPWEAVAVIRKSTGAANSASVGLTMNATNVRDSVVWSSSLNEAHGGSWWQYSSPRITSYDWGGYQVTATGFNAIGVVLTRYGTADAPTATITSVILNGLVGDALITQGADEMHVYALATS